MANYVLVSNEQLKTWHKCLKACQEHLAEGKSVVIDNTNSKAQVRAVYISAAKALEVPVRCFYFSTPKETCIHNNLMRKVNEHRKHLSKAVPAIAIHTFFKNLQVPTVSEGFESVIKIDFLPDNFANAEDKKCYEAATASTAGK